LLRLLLTMRLSLQRKGIKRRRRADEKQCFRHLLLMYTMCWAGQFAAGSVMTTGPGGWSDSLLIPFDDVWGDDSADSSRMLAGQCFCRVVRA
jgi:hypothetical protein